MRYLVQVSFDPFRICLVAGRPYRNHKLVGLRHGVWTADLGIGLRLPAETRDYLRGLGRKLKRGSEPKPLDWLPQRPFKPDRRRDHLVLQRRPL